MKIKDRIFEEIVKLLRNKPEGLRYSELRHKITENQPDINSNYVSGVLVKLDVDYPDIILKPSKGLFKLKEFDRVEPQNEIIKNVKEKDFYKPFADWIVSELEECTKAIELGGSKFPGKWGTPDIIGVKESKKSDIIQFTTEVVTAEIKLDTQGLITAFGQVCAYKLFSHKVYLVIPNNALQEDVDRIDSLCMIYGIGLILYNSKDSQNPNFDIRVRALRHEPDMFYLNENLKLIEKELF